MTELQAESDGIAAVTLDEARAAATRWAKPGDAAIVVVGDRKKVEAGLREIGEVVVLDSGGEAGRLTPLRCCLARPRESRRPRARESSRARGRRGS